MGLQLKGSIDCTFQLYIPLYLDRGHLALDCCF